MEPMDGPAVSPLGLARGVGVGSDRFADGTAVGAGISAAVLWPCGVRRPSPRRS